MLKQFFVLTKPGIIIGNLIPAIASFLLASKTQINWILMIEMIIGVYLVIASACIFNNYFDRDIDSRMERTQKRIKAWRAISPNLALVLGGLLGLLGIFELYFFTNPLTTLLGVAGFIFYVFFYTFSKHHTVVSTEIGSISGAIPPVAGYTAVSHQIDKAAIILFLILVFWQMPHFYAIGIFRLKDYQAAKVPILPVKNGLKYTRFAILGYVLAFLVTSISLSYFGYTGKTYFVVMLFLGLAWIMLGLLGFRTPNLQLWAKKMFRFSLIVILVVSVIISINTVLP